MDYADLAETIDADAEADQELFVDERRKRKVEWDGTTVKSVETERDSGASLRLYEDERIGFSYANRSEIDASWLLDRSRRTRSMLPQDEYHTLSDTEPSPEPIEAWYDSTVDDSPTDRVEAITDRIQKCLDDVETLETLQVTLNEKSLRTRIFRNGRPVAREHRSRFTFSCWAICDNGEDVQSGFENQSSYRYSDLDHQSVLQEAARRGEQKLGASPPDSRTGAAILDQQAASGLLRLVKQMTDGEAVVKGRSAWDREKLGDSVGNDRLTVVDDPALEDGAGNRHFDAEGHEMDPVTILKDGTYETFLTNQYVARRTGLNNNHRASRTYTSRPSVGTTNFHLRSGTTPVDDMRETLGDGPVITGIQPASGLDPVAGHFSVGCSGYFLRGGQVGEPFDEATITGEIEEFLGNVEAVGTQRPRGYSVASPALLVSAVNLGGN